ncbi:gag-pol polyprotein, partial [Trifolium medium]|nr:gag-pol polyprotein [Trifolium medium]
MGRIDRRPRTNFKNIALDISYGHIRTECATYLKKQKKVLTVSWFDEDESEGEVETEAAKHITALTGICVSDTESCDEDISYEELVVSYKELCIKS